MGPIRLIAAVARAVAFVLAWAVALALAASAFAAPEPLLSRVHQLTFEGARSGEGYFSPDGTKLIFQSEREAGNPFYQIYVLDLTSGDARRVSTGAGKTTCSYFLGKSGRVVFASTHLDPDSPRLQKEEFELRASGKERRYAWDYDEHFDVFSANEDGTDLRRLTDARGYDAECAASPDGSKIVFCSMRSAYPPESLTPEDRKRFELNPSYFGEIYIMNADGSGQTRLTNEPGYDGGPFFTPDGKRIVWRRFDKEGMLADIYTMALDGSDVRRLTQFGAMSWAPYFHPSGDYAVFASNKLGFGNFEIYMVDAKGEKEPVRVTFTDGFDGLPVFSPDGKSLCWTSQRGGGKGGQLFMADWDDAHAREALAGAPPRAVQPATPPTAAAAPAPAPAPAAEAKTDAAPDHKYEAAIAEDDLRAIVEYLASDALEGRMTGAPGELAAAAFIEARFKASGLQPLPGAKGFTQEFSFTSGVEAGEKNSLAASEIEANPHKPFEERAKGAKPLPPFAAEKDFRPLAFSDDGAAEGALAFAGYGLVVPGENGAAPVYDSYAGLDVKGKIVLILRWAPEDLPSEKRALYNRYAGLRYKALQARERGAVGLLVVAGPNSPTAGELTPLSLDAGGSTSGIVAASVTIEAADRLLASAKKSLKDLQTSLDKGDEKIAFDLPDRAARLETQLRKIQSTGRNVIGWLPPHGAPADSPVVFGAHYDHLGRGGAAGNSLARKGEEGMIHHGADDNASGVAALLEIAGAAAADGKNERPLIFAAWSGEEVGLLGSNHFCKSGAVAMDKVVAYLNMDMVGRVRENKLMIQGVGSAKEWRALIEKRNVPFGFALSLSDDPYLPTDSTSFYTQGAPGLHFFSGSHEDYHRPSDTADKINYPDLARVARFVGAIGAGLTKAAQPRPEYAKVERATTPGGGGRDSLRAYLGTIPDYANEGIEGVLLSGVAGGGPADKAGLRGGDIIVELAGQKIKNIYDYTYALDAVKIGQAAKIVVTRKGERAELTITPEARK